MKFAKIFRAAAAFGLAVSLCGCSIRFGTNSEPDNGYYLTKPNDSSLAETMGVTYGEYKNDYTYFLNFRGIKDDQAPNVSEECKERRKVIVESLILEKISQVKAEEYGVAELTAEELETVQKATDAIIEERIDYYAENLGLDGSDVSDLSEEEKREKAGEALDKALAECGLTRDYYFEKQKRYYLGYKVLTAIGETIDRADSEKTFDEYARLAKETYESSVTDYEQSNLQMYYIPEGSRYIKQIMLGFDNETSMAIVQKRSSGDSEGADSLREEKADELSDKLEEVRSKLEAGENWSDVSSEYNTDRTGSLYNPDGYLVIPNGTTFPKEFQESAFVPEKIGDMKVCVSDYGVHLLMYAGDAAIDEYDKEIIVENLFAEAKQEEYNSKMKEFIKDYGYYDNLDYNIVKFDKPVE